MNVTGVLLTGTLPTDGSDPLEPIAQPIAWPRGADGSVRLTVVNESGVVVDLTGATCTMTVRRADTDPTPQIHISESGDSTGATLALVAANTSALAQEIYDVDFWVTIGSVKSQVIPLSDFTVGGVVGP